MTPRSRIPFLLLPAALATVALLGACASPASPTEQTTSDSQSSQSDGKIIPPEQYFSQPAEPIPAPGEVHGIGTVIQIGNAAPQICFGPVAESSPPQCSGPEILGWTWTDSDYHETSGTTQWGTYAVTGTWDGERFTSTETPILYALYDTLPVVDPYLDPARPGTTPEARLVEIQTAIEGSVSFLPLTTRIENGYLFVSYIYDDSRLQRYLTEAYGTDVVIVRPALLDRAEG
ncbi:MAG: hypothetical protein ABIW32_00780 [Terrimesophilobacter sp.]